MTIEELVVAYYSNLNDNDKIIWNYIKDHKEVCTSMPIEVLAKKCNVSRTTISRFAKKLHLDGYAELKYYLKKNTVRQTQADRQIDIEDMFWNYHYMLDEIRHKDFSKVAKMIDQADRVIVVSTGTMQRLVAQELERLFMKSGKFMNRVSGPAEMEQLPNWLAPKDLVIFISLSGERDEVVDLAKKLKVNGVPIISITRVSTNSLAKQADEAVYVQFNDVELNESSHYMNLTMFFTIIELLYIYYYNYKIEQEGAL